MTPKAGAKPSRLGAPTLFSGVGKAALHCPREVKYSAGRFLFGQEENESQPEWRTGAHHLCLGRGFDCPSAISKPRWLPLTATWQGLRRWGHFTAKGRGNGRIYYLLNTTYLQPASGFVMSFPLCLGQDQLKFCIVTWSSKILIDMGASPQRLQTVPHSQGAHGGQGEVRSVWGISESGEEAQSRWTMGSSPS